MEKSVIIIPSMNPDERLIDYVKELIAHQFPKIIILDDGSCQETKGFFTTLQSFPECTVLTHAVNMGKGRALKDAFNYYFVKNSKDFSGVITVDSDGQHTVEDVIRMAKALERYPHSLILGVRDFDVPMVPLKSRFGNKMTRIVTRWLIGSGGGIPISDTQTGLRGIPNGLILSYLTLFGERFEYEMSMLIEAIHSHTSIQEVPIQTVYLNGNESTHFRPIADSAAIYGLIFKEFFRYTASSFSAFVVDYVLFCAGNRLLCGIGLGKRIVTATILARILSSFYNYNVNRHVVFRCHSQKSSTFLKYYLLCLVQMGCSAGLVWFLSHSGCNPEAAKLMVDVLLFGISFQIQRRWVFGEGVRDGL